MRLERLNGEALPATCSATMPHTVSSLSYYYYITVQRNSANAGANLRPSVSIATALGLAFGGSQRRSGTR